MVFAHGYGRWSAAWRPHIERVTAELGVAAVAMDYRGTVLPPDGGTTGARGWQVREGAADSIAVAQALLLACPSIDQVTLFSVSMGSNAAGLALARQPVRADGTTPLFDWWLNLEGAVASHETYLAARALAASGNQLAVEVTQDIERQNGGPIEEQPAAYREMSVVSHAEAIATSGVQGVLHVHGLEDGLVPYDQARELSEQLRVHGLPQEFVTLLRRDPDNAPDQQNDNLTNYVVRPVDPAYDSPFAGHGDERFADNDVMATGFARLGDLVGGVPISACAEVVLDAGETYAAPAC